MRRDDDPAQIPCLVVKDGSQARAGTQGFWRLQSRDERHLSQSGLFEPIAWKIRAREGYKLSRVISVKVTDLPYIDDIKIFASSESKLMCVMESA